MLGEYVKDDSCETPFDMKSVPLSAQPLAEQTVQQKPTLAQVFTPL